MGSSVWAAASCGPACFLSTHWAPSTSPLLASLTFARCERLFLLRRVRQPEPDPIRSVVVQRAALDLLLRGNTSADQRRLGRTPLACHRNKNVSGIFYKYLTEDDIITVAFTSLPHCESVSVKLQEDDEELRDTEPSNSAVM